MKAVLPSLSVLPRSIPVRPRHLVPLNLRHAVGELCPALTQERILGAPLLCGNLDYLKIPTDDSTLRFVKTKPSLSMPE